jgi:CarD family transcriptional regulator
MYNIGDKIVYPMHGAGVIESIEEKEILGEKQKYYVLKMPIGDMKVMIPTKSAISVGIRDIINTGEVTKVFEVFKEDTIVDNINWNKRYRENMLKIKSGNIYEVADVVRTLLIREKERGLSTGERKMLSSAKQILVSELVLANNMDPDSIEGLIDSSMQDFLEQS